MSRLKHLLRNNSDRTQFVTFELSTHRYRLGPSEEFHFFYDSESAQSDEPPLILDFIEGRAGPEIVIWTNFGTEEGPFLPDGRDVETNWDNH
jgi:hypothetical protein